MEKTNTKIVLRVMPLLGILPFPLSGMYIVWEKGGAVKTQEVPTYTRRVDSLRC